MKKFDNGWNSIDQPLKPVFCTKRLELFLCVCRGNALEGETLVYNAYVRRWDWWPGHAVVAVVSNGLLGKPRIEHIETSESLRRRGLASELWRGIERHLGVMVHSAIGAAGTASGEALLAKLGRGEFPPTAAARPADHRTVGRGGMPNVGAASRAPVTPLGSTAPVRLTEGDKQLVASLYRRSPLTVDELPYTEHFDAMYREFCARTGLRPDHHQLWVTLQELRRRPPHGVALGEHPLPNQRAWYGSLN